MSYPRSVYHKDYNPHAVEGEKELKKHCKLVHNEQDHKNLGKDWGYEGEKKDDSEEVVVEKVSRKKKAE